MTFIQTDRILSIQINESKMHPVPLFWEECCLKLKSLKYVVYHLILSQIEYKFLKYFNDHLIFFRIEYLIFTIFVFVCLVKITPNLEKHFFIYLFIFYKSCLKIFVTISTFLLHDIFNHILKIFVTF